MDADLAQDEQPEQLPAGDPMRGQQPRHQGSAGEGHQRRLSGYDPTTGEVPQRGSHRAHQGGRDRPDQAQRPLDRARRGGVHGPGHNVKANLRTGCAKCPPTGVSLRP